ncbi:hypothetical protein DN820_10600 [Stutzerimonas nosocomialis]|uniref:DUF3618 domain-containing protein n=1 Tax=Stutzerimonas nosocomialis TaxID=1056496 RepID=A0A5R9QWP3_9GAMM|nr:DUF3618 domain-containing protein [Stutzerimonas nosocomialis]TLX63535.1 hypothetical protein DN820_10600 [Stutzerimonas nosocomialis]
MSTNNQIDLESQKDPKTLEREIDQQRAEIGDIVTALENKLSPGELIDTALGYVKGGGGEFFSNLSNTVKANPVPTLLTSVGLIWLMAGQNRRVEHSYSTGPSLGDKLGAKADGLKHQGAGIKEKASHLQHDVASSLSSARDRVSNTSHQAADTLRHTADSLRDTADRARGGFSHLLQEQPLAVGAIGIALGALLAASVPSTRQEDELMGEARDDIADKLKHKAQEGYERVSEVGEDVARQVKQDMSNDNAQTASRPH